MRTLALSPEGDRFASGSDDGAVKIWDLGGFQVDEMSVPEKQRAILSEFIIITFMKRRDLRHRKIEEKSDFSRA